MLKRAGLQERLKVSHLYDFYCKVADKPRIEGKDREVDFYRNLLGGFRKGDLIFDVGANVGDKTDIFLRLGARVVAVEPDEACRNVLKEKFLKYRVAPKPVAIVCSAASDSQTRESMWIDGDGSALNTFSQKWVESLKGNKDRFPNGIDSLEFARQREVETTTLEQLTAEHGLPFFVKIDVEGYEPKVLRGLRHSVPYLSFEVNLPEFRPEGLECVDLLARLAADGKFNYAVDCRQGLVLDEWLGSEAFSKVLGQCSEQSIEVFWKTPVSR